MLTSDVTVWENEESLESFLSSMNFPAYLQIFFGFSNMKDAPPFAFVTLAPAAKLYSTLITVFTLNYAHPVVERDRHLAHGGTDVHPISARRGRRIHTTWVKEPQVLHDGQIVDLAMIIHSLLPWQTSSVPPPILGENAMEEMGWDGERNRITPLSMEAIQWDLRLSETELEELSTLEDQMGLVDEDVPNEEDLIEHDNDTLATMQLMSELRDAQAT